MSNSQFVQDEILLLPDAYQALYNHFESFEGFRSEYERIADPLEKIRFLRLISVYKNLVKDGKFTVPSGSLPQSNINYYEVTYKFIALISIIEAMFSKDDDDWSDFYEWLIKANKKESIFPIEDPEALRKLYEEYNSEYGATKNAVKFFESLNEEEQAFLKTKVVRFSRGTRKVSEIESTITHLARLLYDRRSRFMHSAVPIVDFTNDPSVNPNRKVKKAKPYTSTLTLNQLMRVFELGFIRHFGMQPERKIPLF
jgi:hypothetical protein